MKILGVEVNYSLHLGSNFQPYIRTDISISGPAIIHTDISSGCAGWVNILFALIDNKHNVEGSESVSISTQRLSKNRPPWFQKVLHVNEKGHPDLDKDILVYMSFTEHHDTQNYTAYFLSSAIINMLGICKEDIVTLQYRGEGCIHSIAFIMRDQHNTGSILGGEESLFNESGELRIERAGG